MNNLIVEEKLSVSVFSYESNRLMSTTETSEYLGYKKGTIYNLVNKGILKPYKCGPGSKGKLRFLKSELDKFLGRIE